eukprot:gene37650-46445_t
MRLLRSIIRRARYTVACEDTRHTQALLRAYGIDKSTHQLLAVHQHNEAEAALNVVQRLQQGQRVAYVSDAGTPGVSDPGAEREIVMQESIMTRIGVDRVLKFACEDPVHPD